VEHNQLGDYLYHGGPDLYRPGLLTIVVGQTTTGQLEKNSRDFCAGGVAMPINWRMISHPMNWLTVGLMLVIAGSFLHLLLTYMGIEPATQAKTSGYAQMPAGQSPGEAASGAISPQRSPIAANY
jgi:hypothetical protein